ncbi:hypothetical protein MMC11_007056 [Xylographa trunciseda]|nr:hypothetical protein [Xylographa trunciseda]
MHILKIFTGVLLGGGGLNVLAHPTANEIKFRESSTLPATLGMLGSYTIVPLIWEGPIVPGGPAVNLTGTITDIKAQILKSNPAYETHFAPFGVRVNTTAVAKRNAIVPADCNVPYARVESDLAQGVIELVEQNVAVLGRCYVPAGPAKCAIVDYAVYDSTNNICPAIYACNDNPYAINVGCQYMAGDYAQTIVNECTSNGMVVGQEFDTDNYNVIVSGTCPWVAGIPTRDIGSAADSTANAMQRRETANPNQHLQKDKPGMLGDYKIVPTTWIGPVFPGGPNVTLTGKSTKPLHDIHQQIRKLNPAYKGTDFAYLHDEHANSTAITKRNAILPPDCNVPFWLARVDSINTCIDEVNNNPGYVWVAAGPRVCSLVWGYGNAGLDDCNAVYLCNDNPYPIDPSNQYLADNYASRILDTCAITVNGVSMVHGQVFDTDNYNVVVSGSCSYTIP